MKKLLQYILSFLLLFVLGLLFNDSPLKADVYSFEELQQQDSTRVKSEKRIYNPKSPFTKAKKKSAKDTTLPYAF